MELEQQFKNLHLNPGPPSPPPPSRGPLLITRRPLPLFTHLPNELLALIYSEVSLLSSTTILSFSLASPRLQALYKAREKDILNIYARSIIPRKCWEFCRLLAALPVVRMMGEGDERCLCGDKEFEGGCEEFLGMRSRDEEVLKMRRKLPFPGEDYKKKLESGELKAMIQTHKKITYLIDCMQASFVKAYEHIGKNDLGRYTRSTINLPSYGFTSPNDFFEVKFDLIAQYCYYVFLYQHTLLRRIPSFHSLWVGGFPQAISFDGGIPNFFFNMRNRQYINFSSYLDEVLTGDLGGKFHFHSLRYLFLEDARGGASGPAETLISTGDLDTIVAICEVFRNEFRGKRNAFLLRSSPKEEGRRLFKECFFEEVVERERKKWCRKVERRKGHMRLVWPGHVRDTETLGEVEWRCREILREDLEGRKREEIEFDLLQELI